MTVPAFREFIRRLYRNTATEDQRQRELDRISDAVAQQREQGKTVVALNRSEGGIQYQMLRGWSPDAIDDAIDFARGIVSVATAEEALGNLHSTPATRPDFSCMR